MEVNRPTTTLKRDYTCNSSCMFIWWMELIGSTLDWTKVATLASRVPVVTVYRSPWAFAGKLSAALRTTKRVTWWRSVRVVLAGCGWHMTFKGPQRAYSIHHIMHNLDSSHIHLIISIRYEIVDMYICMYWVRLSQIRRGVQWYRCIYLSIPMVWLTPPNRMICFHLQ